MGTVDDITKNRWEVTDARGIPMATRRAFKEAMTMPTGPVYVAYSSAGSSLGKIIFSRMAAIAERPIPFRINSPVPKLIPPIPNTRTNAMITMFLGCDRSFPARTSEFIPIAAIAPNMSVIIPPITGVGMV
ncbi:MAG: hypothetical protein GY934_01110 [Gammaproteobacteria bacterium]|nr:hypothetical protein [Gammaproteobacteria bacterium]